MCFLLVRRCSYYENAGRSRSHSPVLKLFQEPFPTCPIRRFQTPFGPSQPAFSDVIPVSSIDECLSRIESVKTRENGHATGEKLSNFLLLLGLNTFDRRKLTMTVLGNFVDFRITIDPLSHFLQSCRNNIFLLPFMYEFWDFAFLSVHLNFSPFSFAPRCLCRYSFFFNGFLANRLSSPGLVDGIADFRYLNDCAQYKRCQCLHSR